MSNESLTQAIISRLILTGCDCDPHVTVLNLVIEIRHARDCASTWTERRVAMWN